MIKGIKSKTLLNPTSGFLSGFTHTINPYSGCQLGKSLCGNYCYAKAIAIGMRQDTREWGTYLDIKTNASELYEKDFFKLRKQKGNHSQINIFMSSVTDPYPPIERDEKITRGILESMIYLTPDSLVLQTHTPLVLRDIDLIEKLVEKSCNVAVQVTVETDMENYDMPNFKTKINFRHAYSVKSRLDALKRFKAKNIFTVSTISPLLPLKDPCQFAAEVGKKSHYAILDHYLLGDGSYGKRTSSEWFFNEPLSKILEKNEWSDWTKLDKFFQIVSKFKDVLGENRVGVSKEGFTSVLKMAQEFYSKNSKY